MDGSTPLPSYQSLTNSRATLQRSIVKTTPWVGSFILLQLGPAILYNPPQSLLIVANITTHCSALFILYCVAKIQYWQWLRNGVYLIVSHYLWWSSLLWQVNLGSHYFYLLAVVSSGFYFSSQESRLQLSAILIWSTLYLLLSTFWAWPMNTWPERIQVLNDTTLLVASLTVLSILQRMHQSHWRVLRTRYQQATHKIAEILPLNDSSLRPWQTGKTQQVPIAGVLFADIKGYTELSNLFSEQQMVKWLDCLYQAFDQYAAAYGVEKIKTNGDQYMAAIGIPKTSSTANTNIDTTTLYHACLALNRFALQLQRHFIATSSAQQLDCELRIGIAFGPVTVGIIGTQKPSFDVWGKTVILAARLEQQCQPGRVHCCAQTQAILNQRDTLETPT